MATLDLYFKNLGTNGQAVYRVNFGDVLVQVFEAPGITTWQVTGWSFPDVGRWAGVYDGLLLPVNTQIAGAAPPPPYILVAVTGDLLQYSGLSAVQFELIEVAGDLLRASIALNGTLLSAGASAQALTQGGGQSPVLTQPTKTSEAIV